MRSGSGQASATEGADHVRYLVRLTELELIDRERRMVYYYSYSFSEELEGDREFKRVFGL